MATEAGTFDVLGWGALQNGSWGQLTHRAGAGAAEAGWQPTFCEPGAAVVPQWILLFERRWERGGWKAWDVLCNSATPRIYARFPFFNSMNLTDAFGEVMLRPGKKLTIRSDLHGLWLSNKNDLWYSGGGAFQPGTFGFNGRPSNGASSLATLYDISGDYNWKYGLSFGLYFGYAMGGDVVKKIYPVNSNGALGFTEINYRF